MLVNDPSLTISSVQSTAMEMLSFDAIWNSFHQGGGGGGGGGEEREEGDENYSHSNPEKWQNGNVEMEGEAYSSSWHEKKNIGGVEKGSFVSSSERPRVGLRRLRRAASDYGGKLSSLHDRLLGLNFSASVGCNLGTLASTTCVNSGDGKESLKEIGLFKRRSPSFEIDESQCGGDRNVIRFLEQALDEEHAGRTALFFELEKERIAASTAADEAMAMILRLQAEKASLEMEAKQYLRMIEEETAFDAEEMDILKEILLRREREKLFLEKEVEAYKQMFFDKDQFYTDEYDMTDSQEQMTSNEEPVRMSEKIPQSIGKELQIPGLSEDAGSMNSTIEEKHKHPSKNDYEINQDFEKGMTTSKDKNLNLVDAEIVQPLVDSGIDRNVFDVHVIHEDRENRKDNKSITSNSPKTCDYPIGDGSETEIGRKRNSSDRSCGLPPIAPSTVKSLPPICRGNSMPAFDYKKFKIDNEVGLLVEKLRTIQQGREKLNIPTGPKEREQSHKQIMENIASQLREMRQLSVPGKALLQAALPPPSSKVLYYSLHRQNLRRTLFCMITSCSSHF
ncbi:hypothetical protein V6N13_040939 [Hibiscus sabdariffa]|uniref:GTD-binding domain-containing protein n=1 Tax=Hibiscus sabdariffa TaxID=183260 RepID=A0ABR2RA59_9ROSI